MTVNDKPILLMNPKSCYLLQHCLMRFLSLFFFAESSLTSTTPKSVIGRRPNLPPWHISGSPSEPKSKTGDSGGFSNDNNNNKNRDDLRGESNPFDMFEEPYSPSNIPNQGAPNFGLPVSNLDQLSGAGFELTTSSSSPTSSRSSVLSHETSSSVHNRNPFLSSSSGASDSNSNVPFGGSESENSNQNEFKPWGRERVPDVTENNNWYLSDLLEKERAAGQEDNTGSVSGSVRMENMWPEKMHVPQSTVENGVGAVDFINAASSSSTSNNVNSKGNSNHHLRSEEGNNRLSTTDRTDIDDVKRVRVPVTSGN